MVPNTRFMGCPPQKPVTAHLTWVAPREPDARPVRERPGVAGEPGPDRPLAQPQHSWTEVRPAATEPIAAALPAQRRAPWRDPAPAVPVADREARGWPPRDAPGWPPVAERQSPSPVARWPRPGGPRARRAPA